MQLARYLNKVPGHPPEFDGRIGTMYEIYEPFTVASRLGTAQNGHRFLVALDPVEPGERPNHIMAAALELEPVSLSDSVNPE